VLNDLAANLDGSKASTLYGLRQDPTADVPMVVSGPARRDEYEHVRVLTPGPEGVLAEFPDEPRSDLKDASGAPCLERDPLAVPV
jgi:hypothetical protein